MPVVNFNMNERNIVMDTKKPDHVRQTVRDRYGKLATASPCGCGSSLTLSCCAGSPAAADTMGQRIGYSPDELDGLTDGANMGLGCGNPSAIGKMKPGETVLDLGSGGGIDCFLAAKAVGDSGRVIGVDMTAEMVSKARENAEKVGTKNVEFRLGEIEHLPVADAEVNVILSNCVINLSPEKEKVFREAYRVLKSGGRLAISDVVSIAPLPEKLKEEAAMLTGCVVGAEPVERLEVMLKNSGFININIQVRQESKTFIKEWFPGSGVEQYVASADIEAIKP
jgi:SAM-dependent methyltransferase